MTLVIVASVIARNSIDLEKILVKLKGHIKEIQLDFMDGMFVKAHSLDFDFILPDEFNFEAHLMVVDPKKWLHTLPEKIQKVIIHFELNENVDEVINEARLLGKKVFIAINPTTPIESIYPYLLKIDGVLIMSVEPGKYGAKFIPEMLKKINYIKKNRNNLQVEIDGGMNPITARQAYLAGADIITSGSFIINNENVVKAINELKRATSWSKDITC
jgi:ribulose-phosphate 3-epimerase